jgi:hypothetical protein
MTYKGIAKGKTIELEDPLPYPEGQAIAVSIEPLGTELSHGSPAAILKVTRDLPHIKAEDVDELEHLIRQGTLPVRVKGEFGGDAKNSR